MVKHAGVKEAAVVCRERTSSVSITVTDRGGGFDGGAVGRPRSVGGGLGLCSICGRLETLGGAMRIRSSPAGGSAVTIELPRDGVDRHEAPHAPTPEPAPDPARPARPAR